MSYHAASAGAPPTDLDALGKAISETLPSPPQPEEPAPRAAAGAASASKASTAVRHLRSKSGNLSCGIVRTKGVLSSYSQQKTTCPDCLAASRVKRGPGRPKKIPTPAPTPPDASAGRDLAISRAEADLLRSVLRCIWAVADVSPSDPAHKHMSPVVGILRGVPGLIGKGE